MTAVSLAPSLERRVDASEALLRSRGVLDEAALLDAQRSLQAAGARCAVSGERMQRRPRDARAVRRHEVAVRGRLRALAALLAVVGLEWESAVFRRLADAPTPSSAVFADEVRAGFAAIEEEASRGR